MKITGKMVPGVAGLVAAVVVVFTVPVFLCSRGAARWMAGDRAMQLELARGVERVVLSDDLSLDSFRTGSSQFNGEWLFGSYLMAGIGFAQVAMQHPDLRAEQAELAQRCIDNLLTPEVRAFDKGCWGEDPIESLGTRRDHAAYLGYFNVLLGLYRLVADDADHADLNDRITAHLIDRLAARRDGLLQSYPGEVYPVDNCFVIGSIGLHQRATGQDHSAVIDAWTVRVRSRYVDPASGLLVQAVDPRTGAPVDAPRGSGTALGLIPLHYANPKLARELYQGIKASLAGTWCGFGAVREYPRAHEGSGDIDSGPVVFGFGMAATGFSIAGAKRYADERYFRRLYATARLCGAPRARKGRREYVAGGPLGNAILFAMLTTPADNVSLEEGMQ